MIENGKLNCFKYSISNFPEELLNHNCSFKSLETVQRLTLQHQNITELGADAFRDFRNVKHISMSYNHITKIHKDAFRGLRNLKSLYLYGNRLSIVEDGALDSLTEMKYIDIRSNNLQSYTTKTWHFCNLMADTNISLAETSVYKKFSYSPYNEVYCDTRKQYQTHQCIEKNKILDCQHINDISKVGCYILNNNHDYIIFNFPADSNSYNYEYFKTNSYTNFMHGSREYLKHLENFTLYEIEYDLSQLHLVTSQYTKYVSIKADYVYTSSPIVINHFLNVQARIVALDYPITMNLNISKEILAEFKNVVEPWGKKEELYFIDQILMKKTSLGLVTIFQSLKEQYKPQENVCNPDIINFTNADIDTKTLYDTTSMNLIYLYTRSLSNSKQNSNLVDDISSFMWNYAGHPYSIVSLPVYVAAQRFRRLLQSNEYENIVNVPNFSLEILSDMTKIMYKEMENNRLYELSIEEDLKRASDMLADMLLILDSVQIQQTLYFENEKRQSQLLLETGDNIWISDNKHRNETFFATMKLINSLHETTHNFKNMSLELKSLESSKSYNHAMAWINSYN